MQLFFTVVTLLQHIILKVHTIQELTSYVFYQVCYMWLAGNVTLTVSRLRKFYYLNIIKLIEHYQHFPLDSSNIYIQLALSVHQIVSGQQERKHFEEEGLFFDSHKGPAGCRNPISSFGLYLENISLQLWEKLPSSWWIMRHRGDKWR